MTDHDLRYDTAIELQNVADELESADMIVQAIEAREAARALYIEGTLSPNRAIKLLCRLEDLL